MDVDVQDEVVDALAEGPVAAGLEVAGRIDEGRAAGERLGPHDRLAVDVGGRRGGAHSIAAQVAGHPELAADLVGLRRRTAGTRRGNPSGRSSPATSAARAAWQRSRRPPT